jgi:hypothetical protein
MINLTNLKSRCTRMSQAVFEVISKFSKRITLTKGRYMHISEKHPEVTGELEKMKETLVAPHMIRKSTYDKRVWLFYKLFKKTPVSEKYLMVGVRLLNGEGLGLQATSQIKSKWVRKFGRKNELLL